MSNENEVKRGRGRPKVHTDVPSHLVCSVTGKSLKTTPVQFRKQLEKSGLSREVFLATYVSREGRKIQKETAKAVKASAALETAEPAAPEAAPAVASETAPVEA